MVDFRYHVTTLVAVFLALAIGILIGTTMVGDQVLVQQQKRIIDRLESDFAALREQSRESRQEIAVFKAATDNYRNFAREIYPLLVGGRLQGIQGALILTGSGQVSKLASDLSLSGMEISPVITVKPYDNGETGSEGRNTAEEAVLDPPDPKMMAKQMADFVLGGKPSEPFRKWHSQGLFDIHTPHNGTEPDVIIIVGGWGQDNSAWVKKFDVPLIREFKSREKIVVGTEYNQVKFSYIPYYQLEGISTVDDIDLALGQTALAFLLEGRPGHYGIKPTAKALLPELD